MIRKTLAGLVVSAFVASTANAIVIYNNEGTTINVGGSVRLVLGKSGLQHHTHTLLKDDGSRITFGVEHQLADDFYALGRLDLRVKDSGTAYAKRAYVGIGSKRMGEFTFGNQVTTADGLSTAKDYTYGLIHKGDYIPKSGSSVIRYTFKGIDNLQLGASYIFAQDRDDNNEVAAGKISNVFQVGAIYKDGIIAKIGFGRTNYKADEGFAEEKENPASNGRPLIYNGRQAFYYDLVSTGKKKHYKNAILASLGYDFGNFIISVDSGYAKEKKEINKEITKKFFVSPGFQVSLTPNMNVYGNYKFEKEQKRTTDTSVILPQISENSFLLGVDYSFNKYVKLFIEGKYVAMTTHRDGFKIDVPAIKVGKHSAFTISHPASNIKNVDKAIGVGLRVYF